MDWSDGYIAVDWGTTNRRAFRIGGPPGAADRFADELGVLNMGERAFESEVEAMRRRLGEVPLLMAGMVGSNRGWRETEYVDCPAGPAALARSILWIEPGWTGIVPGVCQRGPQADVMRGEEVQAIGAVAAGLAPREALVCHPGTHSKWVALAGGEIRSLQTVMTGEIWALLQTRSILSDRLASKVEDGGSFRKGARKALAGAEPIATLFGIRARALLGASGTDDAAFASGLLIGADVRAGLASASSGPVWLNGRKDLCMLYAAALEEAGRQPVLIDGSSAFLAGIAAIVEEL